MATGKYTFNAICCDNLWIGERDQRNNAYLHNALDRILACPYDDLKLTISTCLDAMIALRFERDEAADRRKIDPSEVTE